MARRFNVTGSCNPKLHYMVDLTERLKQIREMIDRGDYFTINRARQYGKTTMLTALAEFLKKDYIVISMDFQMIGNEEFSCGSVFSKAFARRLLREVRNRKNPTEGLAKEELDSLECSTQAEPEFTLGRLFEHLSDLCDTAEKPVVLIIDEVDSAANNQVFLDFLAQLRAYYLKRAVLPTFQSVILVGVYDVKNIRMKIRQESEHKVNSPWNIAANFLIDMSFSVADIGGMLQEYEADYHTGMNVEEMAELLYDYTSGYPVLVSSLCKLIDERVAVAREFPGKTAAGTEDGELPDQTAAGIGDGRFPDQSAAMDGEEQHPNKIAAEVREEMHLDKTAAWTREGLLEAVKMLLVEQNTLFESLMGKLFDYPELSHMVYAVLFGGERIAYNPDEPWMNIAQMFGLVKNKEGALVVANRIFEMRLYNYFLSTSKAQSSEIFRAAAQEKSQFIRDGHLDMERILQKFVEHYGQIYGDHAEAIDEEEGRRRFLLYLRPIINGTGNYYIEAETRNARRMDVVVDYRGEQSILELKIWRGNAYNERGEQQLMDYLDYFHLKKGYMLSYNFNQHKEAGIKKIRLGDRVLIEAVV